MVIMLTNTDQQKCKDSRQSQRKSQRGGCLSTLYTPKVSTNKIMEVRDEEGVL